MCTLGIKNRLHGPTWWNMTICSLTLGHFRKTCTLQTEFCHDDYKSDYMYKLDMVILKI